MITKLSIEIRGKRAGTTKDAVVLVEATGSGGTELAIGPNAQTIEERIVVPTANLIAVAKMLEAVDSAKPGTVK